MGKSNKKSEKEVKDQPKVEETKASEEVESKDLEVQYPTVAHKIIAENPSKDNEPTFYVPEFDVNLTEKQAEILNKEDGVNFVFSRKNKK